MGYLENIAVEAAVTSALYASLTPLWLPRTLYSTIYCGVKQRRNKIFPVEPTLFRYVYGVPQHHRPRTLK